MIDLNFDWDTGCSEFFFMDLSVCLGKCKVNFAVRLRSHLKTFPFIIHSTVGAVLPWIVTLLCNKSQTR